MQQKSSLVCLQNRLNHFHSLFLTIPRNLGGSTVSLLDSSPTLPEDLPIILKSDPSLTDLYLVLGVLELTPALAVKKFTLPMLCKVRQTVAEDCD